MTQTAVAEAGKKISAANKEKISAAVSALQALIADEEKKEAPASEAAKLPIQKVQTWQDVAAGLQAMIDYITNPDTAEALEGDGDGDGKDADKDGMEGPLLQTYVGAPLVLADSLRFQADRIVQEANLFLYERKFTEEERKKLAASGDALPDGSYPIENAEDLSNAKKAYGHSNPADRAKVKAHINKRAKALGQPALGDSDEKAAESNRNGVSEAGVACAGCGEKVGRYDSFCANCGEPLSTNRLSVAHCVGCGMSLPPDAKFCPDCGVDVQGSLDAQKDLKNAEAAKEAATDTDGDEGANDSATPHQVKFAGATAIAQKNHLMKAHSADGDDKNLDVPAKRVSMHQKAHAAKESAEDILVEGEFIRLQEKAIGRDGTMQIKVIEPGWGSSGYYSKEVLKRDAAKAWPAGTKMYINHPSTVEEKTRPERDLRDLAAVTTSDPIYLEEGPAGPGVYANTKPISTYVPLLEELAPHIGVSIRAGAKGGKATVEGKRGNVIEAILPAPKGGLPNVIDFVTEPGAGGEILQLFESKRTQILEASEGKTPEGPEESNEVSDLELKEARQKLQASEDENRRLRERIVLREAKDIATVMLDKVDLPPISKRRIAEQVSRDPAVDEDGDLDEPAYRKQVKEAVKVESQYIEGLVRTGRPRGLGSEHRLSESADDEGSDWNANDEASLEADFKRLRLPDNIAKEAATASRR